MDVEFEGYIDWLKNWLNEYPENSYLEYERNDETFLVDFSKYSNLSEVSLEIYNSIRSSDLSLDQLNAYINKLGTIISQFDLRAIASQPRSKMAKMFSVIFDTGDISNTLVECITENSYAYVYLMIRVLFEIVLYTKSTPVRSFAHGQIMRNKEVIRALVSISYNPASVPLNKLADDIYFNQFNEDDNSSSLELHKLDKYANPVGEIGFPTSSYSRNIFETLILEMMQSHDLNLCCMGIQLLLVVPTVASKSPKILNELFLFLIGYDDELSYLSSISLWEIIPLLPEEVALNFLKASYSNVLNNEHNVQRLKTFTMIALSCKDFKNLSKYVYRMVWTVYLTMDKFTKQSPKSHSIITEQKIALVLVSTIVSERFSLNLKRQEIRLESLLHQYLASLTTSAKADAENFEYNRTDLLFIRGLIYSLFLMYFSQDSEKNLLVKLKDLTNITVNNTTNPNKYVNMSLLTNNIDPLMDNKNNFISFVYYGTCLKYLEYFVKNNENTVFIQFLDLFQDSLQYKKENMNILFTVKGCLKFVKNPCTVLLNLFTSIQPHIDEIDTEFKLKLLTVLLEMIEYCYLTDSEHFGPFLTKYNETINNKILKLIMRPLLQIQNINYQSILSQHDILVHHLYSCVNNEVITETYITRPMVVDYSRNQVYVGESNVTVVVAKPKFSWGSEYRKILKKQLVTNFIKNEQKVDCCDLYTNLYKVGLICLRLGFYSEAANVFSRLSFVTERHYLWLRILYKFSESSTIPSELVKNHKSEDINGYFSKYVSSVRGLLGLLKVYKTKNVISSHLHTLECWDYGFNYQLPMPILHSYSILTFCLKLGAADLLTSVKDKNYQFEKFIKLFASLKASFKALELIFGYKSRETLYVLSCYQGITTIVLQLLKSLEASKSKVKKSSGNGNNGYNGCNDESDIKSNSIYADFWEYLSEFDKKLDKPDVLYILELFPRKRKSSLLTNLFTTQKVMPKSKGENKEDRDNKNKEKEDKDKNGSNNTFDNKTNIVMENKGFEMKYNVENTQVSLEAIWFDLVGSLRMTAQNGQVYAFHRDVPTFNEMYKQFQPLSQNQSDSKFTAFLESVIFSEIPTPVGILKAFPLPFVSLTAVIMLQKRGEFEVQTVRFQGNLKNCKDRKHISLVSVRMCFNELGEEKTVYKTLKMVEDTVYETVLIKIPLEVCKNGSFIAIPVDKKLIPRGVPSPVLVTQRYV